jgi:hypothetical protein
MRQLCRGNVEGLHPDTVVARHVESQRAPSASCLDDGLAGFEGELLADQIELLMLGRLEITRPQIPAMVC